MKPRKVRNEIHAMVSQIEGIVKPLRLAATQLKRAESKLNKDKSGVNSLAAVEEARQLVHAALTASAT